MEDIFSGHLLSPVFQIIITHYNYKFPFDHLKAARLYSCLWHVGAYNTHPEHILRVYYISTSILKECIQCTMCTIYMKWDSIHQSRASTCVNIVSTSKPPRLILQFQFFALWTLCSSPCTCMRQMQQILMRTCKTRHVPVHQICLCMISFSHMREDAKSTPC